MKKAHAHNGEIMLRLIALSAALVATIPAMSSPLPAQAALSSGNGASPMERSQAVDKTRTLLETYWKSHDPRYVAEDAVFTMMPTGEEIRGRDAIAAHLDAFYHKSFDAHAEVVSSVFGEDKGLLEALVVGKHIGDFGGVAATGKNIRVPLSVAYDIENGLIKRARIYLMANVLFGQITPAPAAASR
jgi:hypothetical protein